MGLGVGRAAFAIRMTGVRTKQSYGENSEILSMFTS